ncbi:MAG: transcriptional repressor [Peptococcaceae bacterium]|nr:transcriptional repressor [Peptococcaceae bacterium]
MNLQVIKEKLKNKGFKLTPQRELIIQTLLQKDRPCTAQEVFSAVSAKHPNISFDTVYRNLNLLNELGIVNLINLKTRFSARFEITGDHHHHLVCLGCGTAYPLPFCPFKNMADHLAEEMDFSVIDHAFEVYGYCKECQKNNSR